MKIKIGIIILLAISIGLFVALFATKKAADDQRVNDTAKIVDYSNQVTTLTQSIDDVRQVNLMLTNDLAVTRDSLTSLSNSLVDTTAALTNTKAMLQGAQDQIADLETRNKVLDDRANELTNSLESLTAQMTETQLELAKANTNNAFLNAELQKQIAEREDLEHKFNDLSAVRAQVKKLRTDEFVALRLKWMREGVYPGQQMKGAQALMQHGPTRPAATPGQYDLNVEVGSDGSMKVNTNAPAQ